MESHIWVICHKLGVGLSDPYESLPTQDILSSHKKSRLSNVKRESSGSFPIIIIAKKP